MKIRGIYTLRHGGFFKRTGYAVSRLFITRTDVGGRTFNFSEIVGNGVGAGISDAYYPARERTWTKTYQKWTTQIALDGVFNIVKEFWPDINHSYISWEVLTVSVSPKARQSRGETAKRLTSPLFTPPRD
jgi:hypothetical protein